MENNLKARWLTAAELNLTEDEYSNMLIDMYQAAKQKPVYSYYNPATGAILESETPINTTIKITFNKSVT